MTSLVYFFKSEFLKYQLQFHSPRETMFRPSSILSRSKSRSGFSTNYGFAKVLHGFLHALLNSYGDWSELLVGILYMVNNLYLFVWARLFETKDWRKLLFHVFNFLVKVSFVSFCFSRLTYSNVKFAEYQR